jgi:O-methyltransferase involved in polyketide biosynthesis
MTSVTSTPTTLTGVAETLLWTLYYRAVEARREDGVLRDPLACELVDTIDYPFAERFGHSALLGQVQALRALRFDQEVRRFLAAYPDGTVVALGEGLETQFWRVGDERVRWLSVDLPDVAALRERLLPSAPNLSTVACSAVHRRWLDEIDSPPDRVLVTAEGLLMYLQPTDARALIAACAERLPGAALVFDAVPGWFSAATMRARPGDGRAYTPPPMPWRFDARERERIRAAANVAGMVDLRLPRGRGPLLGWAAPLAMRSRRLRAVLPSIARVRRGGLMALMPLPASDPVPAAGLTGDRERTRELFTRPSAASAMMGLARPSLVTGCGPGHPRPGPHVCLR